MFLGRRALANKIKDKSIKIKVRRNVMLSCVVWKSINRKGGRALRSQTAGLVCAKKNEELTQSDTEKHREPQREIGRIEENSSLCLIKNQVSYPTYIFYYET